MLPSEPMDLDPTTHKRPMIKLDPRIGIGEIIEILVLLIGGLGAYGTYSSDQAKRDEKIAQVKIDLETTRQTNKDSFSELKNDLKELHRDVASQSETLAVLKERSEPVGRK